MKRSLIYNLVALGFLTIGCGKNKLNGEYAAMQGTYEWQRTGIQTGSFLTIKTSSLTKKDVGYTAMVELNDKGEIIFYKDGNQISKNKYSVKGKERGVEIIIKLKGETKGMSVPDKTLKITLSNDTLLTIDRFPFPAIDKAENYKTGYSNLSSDFARK